MTFLDRMGVSNADELHAMIDARRNAPKPDLQRSAEGSMDADAIASSKAHAYAPENEDLPSIDAWTNRAVVYLNDPANVLDYRAIMLNAGEAYIVPSGEQNIYERRVKGAGRGGPEEFRTWRLAYPLPADGGPVRGPHTGKCDRCWITEAVMVGTPSQREVFPVHVPRFAFVAEFYLCRNCLEHLRFARTPVREVRIAKARD